MREASSPFSQFCERTKNKFKIMQPT